MSDRSWIIECMSVVAVRVHLRSGEVLVSTRHGRLVIVNDEPVLAGLCILRTGDDGREASFEEIEAKLDAHCFKTLA